MSGPRPASMAALNLGTRSAEVTVSGTTLMFGCAFSNSANSAFSAGPAGSSPKYQLMKRSWMGCWPAVGTASATATAIARPPPRVSRIARRHLFMSASSVRGWARSSLQGPGGEAGDQEPGREHVQHDRREGRDHPGRHQLVPGHAVLAEQVGDAHADRVLLARIGQDVGEHELVPGEEEGVNGGGGHARPG